MRRSVTLLEVLLVLALITEAPWAINGSSDCKPSRSRAFRPHSVTITEFGAVGDGTTLNTKAFQNAIFYLRSFADKGGAQLFVPAGRWLTGSFNLISHLTLMLDKEAVILGSIDSRDWPIVDPLPSYGRGRELPGRRHKSLIYGYNLTDVIITGDNGTIDGQGSVWWDSFTNHTLNFTRPHLVELMHSNGVVISNLTFLNSPFWTIHPVYCSQVHIHDITILAPLESPNTDGIDPDSSNDVCIEDCYISTGDDLIAIKSGWDEYGISYARPSTNIFIRRVTGETSSSAGIALGSEMSGGISEVHVEGLQLFNSKSGINIKTSPGRGGYIRNVYISDVTMKNVTIAIRFLGQYGEHPDDNYNASALPIIERITFKNIIGKTIRFAGLLQGIEGDSFHNICLSNITLDVTSDLPWNCSDIQGYSILVSPESCEPLREILPKNSSACYLSNHLPSESSEGSRLVRTMMKFTSMYPLLLW
ncbi:probable polygalacturonase isoform X1 [Magnolia sinica]|uniref:probable polygalacturonase isoform X1 n=1 Tax=Magnolia sinica TaxID=86752 RepID=UPI00265A218C|nr:probable polygalacturonase isoform X1 [Magnolia sinica]